MELTEYLTLCVENNTPVSFSKYGDGEYNCANEYFGSNCDNDNYTKNLKQGLINSFIYMSNNVENSYFGLWNDHTKQSYWEQYTVKPVNWAKYHTILFDQNEDDKKSNLYKSIHNSSRKKIIICNPLLIKSQILLKADSIITVPFNNWFDSQFDQIIKMIIEQIGSDDGNHIILTMCGMGSKVLICELTKLYPKGIYLDIGSGLDKLCTKRESRGFPHSYEYVVELVKDIIPEDWNNSKYDYIYKEATSKLGIHL
jgi:hypothetical protein